MPKRIELALLPEEAAGETVWKQKAVRASGLPEHEISKVALLKRSIDARAKKVLIRLQIDVYSKNEVLPGIEEGRKLSNVSNSEPVIVIGCGPAGLFAALRLIELGFKPVLIERGKNVRDRRRDLAILNKEQTVNADSNYCFGEGGAGTYSDGKLYTRSDKRGNIKRILGTFIEFGASPDIAIDAHPHIGTNKLPGIISAISKAITDCGGEIHFNQRFTGFIIRSNSIAGVICQSADGSNSNINHLSKAVILATGHSARDIFEYLNNQKLSIIAKPFALGVRVEHPQEIIDSVQYHCTSRNNFLPPASYSLAAQADGRGVYSFCMCPGGIIAAAATSPGEIVVNGWSPSKRNNPFANSGMVVSVGESDFKPFHQSGELRALRFQQSVEQKAFEAGGGKLQAPAQRLVDFINHQTSSSLPPCSYIPGIISSSLDDILPKSVADSLREGLKQFSKKMRGYVTNEAVLVATESRTSSPVKIPRDKISLMHPDCTGFFPCGEGAGEAGGIVSAAMDGERVADACASWLQSTSRS
jgi:uncharacterized FAD-dependent dehydrogenase